MITILSQNKALINISDFETIYVDKDEAQHNIIVLNGNYIIGQYDTIEDCIAVIDWIATIIGDNTNNNLTIKMPNEVSKYEKTT